MLRSGLLLATIAQCGLGAYPRREVVGLTVSVGDDVTRRDELTKEDRASGHPVVCIDASFYQLATQPPQCMSGC